MIFPKANVNSVCVGFHQMCIAKVQVCRYLGVFIEIS